MPDITTKLGLKKPLGHEIANRASYNENLDIIDAATASQSQVDEIISAVTVVEDQVEDLKNKVMGGVKHTPALTWGINHIQHNGETPVPFYMRVQGNDYVNLLGGIGGNCEDINKWTYLLGNSSSNSALSTTQKKSGSYSIKFANTSENHGRVIDNIPLTSSKYYMVSAWIYIESYTNGSIRIAASDGGGWLNPIYGIADNTKINQWQRVVCRFTGKNSLRIGIINGATSTLVAYVDEVMLNEISAADDALSDAELMKKYPYVDSDGVLENLYLENRENNLIENGNCEDGVSGWRRSDEILSFTVTNNKFAMIPVTTGSRYVYRSVPVEPNKDYYISANMSATSGTTMLHVRDYYTWALLKTEVGTFNSGNTTMISVLLSGSVDTATYTFDSIMLVPGTTPPTSYKSCVRRFISLETKLTKDDVIELGGIKQPDGSIVYNGKVNGHKWWKDRKLLGKDYDWQFSADRTGFKAIMTPLNTFNFPYSGATARVFKYDGKIMVYDGGAMTIDSYINYADGRFLLCVADSASGWAELIDPNALEIKAYMNGWKARTTKNNRYVLWTNIIDGDYPSIAPQTTLSVSITTSTNTFTVTDATKFSIGNTIFVEADNGGGYIQTITNISGNVISSSEGISGNTTPCSAGTKVVVCDNATTNNLATWCSQNVASGYEGYKLRYKLQNPEPITDINVPRKGDLWSLVPGNNNVYLDSGRVIGEVANPELFSTTDYFINRYVLPSNVSSALRNKVEIIQAIKKNGIYDNLWVIANNAASYGNQRAGIPVANYDTNATYVVDYQILNTLHAYQSAAEISMEYTADMASSIERAIKLAEGKQRASSTLDNVDAMSIYERIIYTPSNYCSWAYNGATALYVQVPIQFTVLKDTIPKITIKSLHLLDGPAGNNLTAQGKATISSIIITRVKASIHFIVTDPDTITSIKNYGVRAYGIDIIADCKGVI